MTQIKSRFPWTKKSFGDFLQTFSLNESIEVIWWWEPFHRPGFNTLRFAAKKNLSEERLQDIVADLSCVAAPAHLKKELQKSGGLDPDGRILSLNPEIQIRETWNLAGVGKSDNFSENAILPVINDVRSFLAQNFLSFVPRLQDLPENEEVTKLLTVEPILLKRFQQLSAWDRLELIESLLGGIISSSTLRFQHLYAE